MMNFGYNARKVKFPNDEKIVVHFDTQDPWQQPASGECFQFVLSTFEAQSVPPEICPREIEVSH